MQENVVNSTEGDEKIRGALLSGKKVLTEGGTGGFFQVLNQNKKKKNSKSRSGV